MSCTSCNVSPIDKDVKEIIVQQLTKTIRTACGGDSTVDIYPRTVTQAIFDACTNLSLEKILGRVNHIYVPFRGDFRNTINAIPINDRRKGLVVTHTDRDGINRTYRYEGNSINNSEWSAKESWRDLAIEDTYTKVKSFRIEGNKLVLEVVNHLGKIIDTFDVNLPIGATGTLATKVVNRLPVNADSNTIYIIESQGGYKKFIWVDQLNRYEELGGGVVYTSGSCVNPISAKTTRVLSTVERNDRDFVFTFSNGDVIAVPLPDDKDTIYDLSTILDRIVSLEDSQINPSELQTLVDRVTSLERKEDRDTVFDPSSINREIEDLKNRVDRDTIYDDSSLRNRISALESKTDRDTIYDDSDLKRRVSELESRPVSNSTSYDDTAIRAKVATLEENTRRNDEEARRRLSTLEAKRDNDTIYDPTPLINEINALKNRVNQLEARTDNDDYIESGLWTDNNTCIEITLKSGRKVKFCQTAAKPVTPPPTPKSTEFSYKFGYKGTTSSDKQKPGVEHLTNSKTFSSLPLDFTIPTTGITRGYYIFAVEKAGLPANYKVQMWFNGGFSDVTTSEYSKSEATIDGKTYVVFTDNSINRDWDGPRFNIVSL